MKNSFYILSCLVFILAACVSKTEKNSNPNPYSGPENYVDSLNWEAHNTSDDSIRLEAYIGIFEEFVFTDLNTAKIYLDTIESIAQKNSSDWHLAMYHLSLGDYLDFVSEFQPAINAYLKAVKHFENTTDRKGLSMCHNNLGYVHNHIGNISSALTHYEKALEIRTKDLDSAGMASTYNNIGFVHDQSGELGKAMQYYSKSVEISRKINNTKAIARGLNNMAFAYQSMGEVPKSVELFKESIQYFEALNNDLGLSTVYNNIGILFQGQKDYEAALEYYQKSINQIELLDDKEAIAQTKSNMAEVYMETGRYKKARKLYNESLRFLRIHGDKLGVAECLVSIGTCIVMQKSNENPFSYFNEAKTIFKKLNYKLGEARVYAGLAHFFSWKGNNLKAEEYANMYYEMSKSEGFPENISLSSKLLYEIFKLKKDYKQALEHHEIYIANQSKLMNERNKTAIINSQFQIEYERQAAADSVQAKADKDLLQMKFENELSSEQNKKYLLFGGIGFTMLIAIFSMYGYQQKRKDNRIIAEQKIEVENQRDQAKISQQFAEEQKIIVEEKNREILDSIQYAKRLQNAILPSNASISKNLQEHYLLYKPKDIVAGDFYWCENLEEENLKYIAVADCTGHGVPGAMVSVVCAQALNKIVLEEKIRKPSEILERAKELIIKTFDNSEESIQDGMDIGIVQIDLKSSKLEYSGANIGLIHIKETNDDRGFELEHIKPTKCPVGKYKVDRKFENHIIEIKDGDRFFIHSDGYPDQFGGKNHNVAKVAGKKLKSSNLRKLILSVQSKDFEDQKDYMNNMFESWKGDLEQIDDVCLLGFKVI